MKIYIVATTCYITKHSVHLQKQLQNFICASVVFLILVYQVASKDMVYSECLL